MKKLLSSISAFLIALCSIAQNSTTIDTTAFSMKCRITYQTGLYNRTDSNQIIIYFVGAGEVSGTTITSPNTTQFQQDTSRLDVYGPHSYVSKSNWDGGVLLGDGIKRYPVIVTVQTTSWGPPSNVNSLVDFLVTTYRVKKGCLHMTGPSMGGWRAILYATYLPTSADMTYVHKVRSIVPVEPVDPSDTYGATPPYAQRMKNFALHGSNENGGKMWVHKQVSGLSVNMQAGVDTMNAYASGSAFITVTSFGAGNHCCFDFNYGGTSPPTAMVVGGLYQNMYQWMLRQGDTTLNKPITNPPPVVNAGADQNITLPPTSSVTVTGTATPHTGGSITGTAWTKISGPSTYTITTPTTLSTTITGLVVGVYVFQFAATDELSQTSQDQLTVTVSSATAPVAHAGGSVHISRHAHYYRISGVTSTGVITSYHWKFLNPTSQPTEGKMAHPNDSATWVKFLPYRGFNVSYDYELSVSDGTTTSKDTFHLFVDWGTAPPQSVDGGTGFHIATASDTGGHSNPGAIHIGDIMVTGANNGASIGSGNLNEIYINAFGGHVFTGTEKVWIKGGWYNKVQIDWDTSKMANRYATRIQVSNYDGQVRGPFLMRFARKIHPTGKYTPGVSGDPNYLGSDGPADFRWGTYGLFFDADWGALYASSLGISGVGTDSSEYDHFQYGEGPFAGVFMKENNVDSSQWFTSYRGMSLHDFYGANTYGEMKYLGSTGDDQSFIKSLNSLVGGSGYTTGTYTNVPLRGGSNGNSTTPTARATIVVAGGVVTTVTLTNTGQYYKNADVLTLTAADVGGTGTGFSITVASLGFIGQHTLQGLKIYEGLDVRAGNEGSQVGQRIKSKQYHNTIIGNALNWYSVFDEFQDMAWQQDFRGSGNTDSLNIVLGSGEFQNNIFLQDKPGYIDDGDSSRICYNLFFGGHGFIMGYVAGSHTTIAQRLTFRNNRVGGYSDFTANVEFHDYRGTNTQELFRTDVASPSHLTFKNNIFDLSKTNSNVITLTSATDTSGNTRTSSITWPKFYNPGYDSSIAMSSIFYVDTIEGTYGDEYPNKFVFGVNQGNTYTFAQNKYCWFASHLYRSRHNGNQGNQPFDGDSTHWQVVQWFNPHTGTMSFNPPDDWRLVQGSTYQVEGLGRSEFAPATPTVSAGNPQTIYVPISSVNLSGSATPVSGHTIASWAWVKISGPGATSIPNPNNQNVTATGLVVGTYVFQVTATQDDAASASSTVTITVTTVPLLPDGIIRRKGHQIIFISN